MDLSKIEYDINNNKFSINNNRNIVLLYNSKKKLVLKAEYKVIGIYDLSNNKWKWAFDNEFIEKNLVYMNKEIDTKYLKKNKIDKEKLQDFIDYLESFVKKVIINKRNNMIELISIESILEIK